MANPVPNRADNFRRSVLLVKAFQGNLGALPVSSEFVRYPTPKEEAAGKYQYSPFGKKFVPKKSTKVLRNINSMAKKIKGK
jgi:hypothetical protein